VVRNFETLQCSRS